MLVRVENKELYDCYYADADEFVLEASINERYYVGGDAKYHRIDPKQVRQEELHLGRLKFVLEFPVFATLDSRENNPQR